MNISRTQTSSGLINRLRSLPAFVRYNAGHVFAGRFIYFLLLGVALFLTIIIIHSLEEAVPPNAEAIYYFLLVPGVLLVFYPASYGIQSDIDSRMIETLFGIPDYRYKVWVARNITQYLVIMALLGILAIFSRFALADFSIIPMLFQLLFPVVFIGSIGFMISSLTRNGNGTAAVLVVIVMFFWIAVEPLEGTRWNLFHNPFANVDQLEAMLWSDITLYNRIYILIASLAAMTFGLFRLQQREKFV
jgi:hypothetical protein